MTQLFYLDLPYFTMISSVFASVPDARFKCFICFSRMLQLLHLNISKLDRVLHLSPRLSTVLPRYQAREAKGGPHWRGQTQHACGRMQQARHGRADAGHETGGSGAGVRMSWR